MTDIPVLGRVNFVFNVCSTLKGLFVRIYLDWDSSFAQAVTRRGMYLR